MPCATLLRRNPQTTSLMVCKHPPHAHSTRRAYFRSNESEITLSTHKHTQRRTSNHNAGSIALQIFTKRRSSTSGITRQSECPRCQGYAGRTSEPFLFSFTFFSSLFKAKRKTQDFNDRRGLGRVSDEPSKVRPSVAEHIFGNQTTLGRTLAPLPSLSLPSSAIAIINEWVKCDCTTVSFACLSADLYTHIVSTIK